MLSAVIAPRCSRLVATDYARRMLEKAKRKCAAFSNVIIREANILSLPYPEGSFDKVVAANVLHLLDEPERALSELARVCRPNGALILPTYINLDNRENTSFFVRSVGKAGADFRRQFTEESYRRFFLQNGFRGVKIRPIHGRIPCAVAIARRGADEVIS